MNEADSPGNATLQRGSSATPATLQRGSSATPARLEPGVPGAVTEPRYGWRSRGYLPHFESADKIQHVTFHLADSLPSEVVMRLDEELRLQPAERRDALRRQRIEAWIDAGHGSCALRDPVLATLMQGSLLSFDDERYGLFAWVVMPNHVHVLFQPLSGWTVGKIVASWKSFTGRRISAHLSGRAGLQPGSSEPATREHGDPGRIWHREHWDRFMRDEHHLKQTVEYIHQNPVKAGLVACAADWRWSSAYPGNATLQRGSASSAKEPARLEPGAPGDRP